MSLRFRQLQAFHAIVETGTVTGAAEQLGISQPGISNLLYQLERQTRLKLFERSKGRLIPTPEAGVLFQEVDTVVRGFDHVAQAVTDLQNKQAGQLQVASQHSLSFGFMPALIARFARTRPDLSISFQAQYSLKIQEWVIAGLFEIGVCEMPLIHDGLEAHPINVETLLAMPADSPLAEHDVLTPELLEGVPFIVMGPDHMTHRRTREVFQQAGIPLKTRVHSHLFKNLLSFVQEGMGVSILDPFVLDFEIGGGFISRPFRPRIMMEMAVITSRSRPLSAVGQEFLALLKQELAPYTAGGAQTAV
ncbi:MULTISPECIES: LysR family transcriptional regulator [unclassified Leisingera]|uniref:LysR family transcriptional regulator n=1 Tax=unclassified Leisingera TaxID=2614906 RepID=UPI001010733B|nr:MULTISPECIES: LysR family transcriptional regulator [unclassified Leisingera]MBQ4824697.1 LysR family transcriptional regulator [Leisingera sp. HS039]MCF6431415.1 LysR family transcriptional regulator [Leisingera sp. MMG026]QAX30429.1 LysR family transcriptional regulator [Leisingera sp. NJS204]QBR35592.1 LysR family transcriptional regulator [Leisingera sp. NJS201]